MSALMFETTVSKILSPCACMLDAVCPKRTITLYAQAPEREQVAERALPRAGRPHERQRCPGRPRRAIVAAPAAERHGAWS